MTKRHNKLQKVIKNFVDFKKEFSGFLKNLKQKFLITLHLFYVTLSEIAKIEAITSTDLERETVYQYKILLTKQFLCFKCFRNSQQNKILLQSFYFIFNNKVTLNFSPDTFWLISHLLYPVYF